MANAADESTFPRHDFPFESHTSLPSGHSWRWLSPPRRPLIQACRFAVGVLLCKVFISILLEYRYYFPANFDAAFLSGRRYTFVGIYRFGFYVHIITGPLTIFLATFLMLSGNRGWWMAFHRHAGRLLWGLVVGLLLPSGLIMASEAYAGPIAAWGFAALTLATAASCSMAANCARIRNFRMHQRWATRTYLLLCSPLLLRIFSGAAIATGLESDLTYRLNAWLSWLIPIAIYEVWIFAGPLLGYRFREVTK